MRIFNYLNFIFIICITVSSFAGQFDEGDWITYKDAGAVYSCDKDRNYVYFASSGGVLRWDMIRLKWDFPLTVADLPGEYKVFDVVFTAAFDINTGILWCGTTKGLLSYNTLSHNWDKHDLPLGDPNILSVGFSAENIWLEGGTAPGIGARSLFKGTPQFGNFTTASPAELETAGAVRWVGERVDLPESFPPYNIDSRNQGGGILIFTSDGKLKDGRFNEYSTLCMLNDDRGNIWLGFNGYGIGKVDDLSRKMTFQIAGPESSVVKSIAVDGNSYWIGGRGLSQWKKSDGFWKRFRTTEYTDFNSGRIEDIVVHGGYVYLATKQGLTIYNQGSGIFYTLDTFDNLWDSEITALAEDGNKLWIGTASGLNSLQFSNNLINREEALQNRRVLDIEVDGPFVWIGGEYGLHLHDKESGEWTFVHGTDAMQDSRVSEIKVFRKEVWVARDFGIEMFDKKTGAWEAQLSVLYGNSKARSICPADSFIWIGTTGGLVKYDRILQRWVKFTKEDGLPDNLIDVIIKDGDYLWLGTPGGLCRFYWNDPYRLD